MEYSFDSSLAAKIGVDEAIVVKNLQFWILKNKANNRHFHAGRWWTYNSVSAFEKIFKFWTAKQIRRILASLVSQKIIITGTFNDTNYDRTTWYAFDDESLFVTFDKTVNSNLHNSQIESTKKANRIYQKVEPIPDNKTISSSLDEDEKLTCSAIVNAYHSILPMLPRVLVFTTRRKLQVKARIRDGMCTMKIWRSYFEHVKNSDFLIGKVKKKDSRIFKADFDWLINPENRAKIIEQKYHGGNNHE